MYFDTRLLLGMEVNVRWHFRDLKDRRRKAKGYQEIGDSEASSESSNAEYSIERNAEFSRQSSQNDQGEFTSFQ